MKKKLIISIIIFAVLVNISIVLSIKIKKQDLEYQTIKCTVSNIERKREYIPFTRITTNTYKVKVWYNNRVYDLKNEDESGWKYKKGDRIDAYYYNDNIYANIQGVKASTQVAKAYFVFVFLDWGMLTVIIIFYISYKRKNNMFIQEK